MATQNAPNGKRQVFRQAAAITAVVGIIEREGTVQPPPTVAPTVNAGGNVPAGTAMHVERAVGNAVTSAGNQCQQRQKAGNG